MPDPTQFSARFHIEAPTLSAFSVDPTQLALNGAISASGEIRHVRGETAGHGRIEGRDLVYRQFSARHLAIDIPVEANKARIAALQLDLNDRDRLRGAGSLQLQQPFAYEGNVSGTVRDMSVFQPLAGTPLAGALDVDWRGSGTLQSLRHSGEGRLVLAHGRIGEITEIEAEAAGRYSPESIEMKVFRIQTAQGSLQARVRLRDQRLQIEQLRLEIGKTATLNGSFSAPLDLRTPTVPATVFPASGALEGAFTLNEVDLAGIFPRSAPSAVGSYAERSGKAPTKRGPPKKKRGISKEPQATLPQAEPGFRGQLSGSMTAGGTLGAPQLAIVLKGRNLQAVAAEKLPPGSAVASIALRDDRVLVNGALSQPGLSPFQFTAAMPLPLLKAITERRIDPETPIAVSVKLPSSPAAWLTLAIPQIRYAEGRISVDASATGTLAHPVLSGGALLDLPAIRFQNEDAPAVGNVRGDLRFSGKELTVRKLQGDVAGGPFAVTGRVTLEQLTDPQLDLRFRSQGTLLVRNDSLTLRTDSDLKIVGPFNSATVTGQVGITKSRFFREIEILPLGLPGRPTPKAAQGGFKPSLDLAPIRGWNFNVAVKTTEPFVVRGNLANGLAYADLHLGGNGLAPTLQGTARIENFVASLPFSRLTVDYGYLHFSTDAPFDPTLDIHGTSRIRNYNIAVAIYGTASEPQTVFTSEPSMPQEEVIALLATGATSKEFTENSQVLAGRAGVLLLQDLYHKVFKRRTPPPESKADQPLDRFGLDVGTVDPRTGRQEINGRFKLSNQYEIGAGVDVQGDVQVQLRYLLRFR